MEDNKKKGNMRRLQAIGDKVPEAEKIKLDTVIDRFRNNFGIRDFTFPNTLSSHERAYVHSKAGQFGMKSQSYGAGETRKLTLSKSMENNRVIKSLELDIMSVSLVQMLEPSHFGYNIPPVEVFQNIGNTWNENTRRNYHSTERSGFTNRLFTSPGPKIPKPRVHSRFQYSREELPIWNFQGQILQAIRQHNVIFIKGDTGCGKTTQVPQFILDDAIARQEKVRIVCTVPRRIAAVTISDRVATERGERVGKTVGFQIRLESKISPHDTILTFCTSGILLRSLTSFDYSVLRTTTHIIIDEVHERDRQTEFLLACLRDVGKQFPHLKIILMGADMNTNLLVSYFGGEAKCPLIQVHGRLYSVKVHYLENVLTILNDPRHQREQQQPMSSRNRNSIVDNLVNTLKYPSTRRDASGRNSGSALSRGHRNFVGNPPTSELACFNAEEIGPLDLEAIKNELDSKIMKVWIDGDADNLSILEDFFTLVNNSQVLSIDYRHSIANTTMLMACSVQGRLDFVEKLLARGADPKASMILQDGRSYTAKDWASDHGQMEVVWIIDQYEYTQALVATTAPIELEHSVQDRLDRYQINQSDERVDLQLIVDLLYYTTLHSKPQDAILVFLPGYEEIVTLKQMIFTDHNLANVSHNFVVFFLHSNIQTGDQRAVFEAPKPGKKKIVLSTNIAETSLTISDVTHVIDSGKVKEKTFDAMTGVTQLKSQWISKASANQRTGRAGRCRPGMCFRLYSNTRYQSMNDFPEAEIVRSSLQELCIYTRSFIRTDLKIQDFFTRLPEPPAPIAVKKSVDALIAMGALDEKQQLTKLGFSLLDFPIEPYLGKALMYAVALKCIDPILTIITIMSHREPFQLPLNPDERKKAIGSKFEFSAGSLSDHMSSLKAFQDWEKSTLFNENVQRSFCNDRYLSAACFEMIYGIRSQLLGQLRAAGFVQNCGANDLKDLNTNSENWPLVKGILTGILYPNICYMDKRNKTLLNEYDTKIRFHNGSVLGMTRKDAIANLPGDWVIYDEISQQDFSKSIRTCTLVSDVPLILFGGNFTTQPIASEDGQNDADVIEGASNTVITKRFDLNNWITFCGTENDVTAILYLKKRLNDLVIKRLQFPSLAYTVEEESVVRIIAEILLAEDHKLGFQQISGIGQWPKLVSGNLMSTPSSGYEQSSTLYADKENTRLKFKRY